MTNTSNFLIVTLLVTAAILGMMLYGTAGANSAGDRTVDRDYIIITGQITDSSSLLYVINIPTKKLVVYIADRGMNNVQIVDAKTMDQIFGR